ncbi:MAG: alpha/beta fold hydrolase [Planctomycetes bacterium]|nr:alpha/beta fold hydrolase [Planctomycetota bacterium]
MLALLLGVAALSPGCNGLFYHPDARRYRPLPPGAEEVWFASGDGTRLHGWFLPAQGEPKGTVLHVHGNAQNLTSHLGFVDWLPARGFAVFAFDYRGYGASAGSPSRQGVFEDACAALDHVLARPDVDPKRVVVFGQSLGGAIATAALGERGTHGVRGVAVDSTFGSYVAMGNAALGGGALTWPLAWLLLSDAHAPEDSVAAIAPVPMLFLHSTHDPVVPLAEGRRLFEAAREPKEFVELPAPGHTVAVDTQQGRERLVGFFERCVADGSGSAAGREVR